MELVGVIEAVAAGDITETRVGALARDAHWENWELARRGICHPVDRADVAGVADKPCQLVTVARDHRSIRGNELGAAVKQPRRKATGKDELNRSAIEEFECHGFAITQHPERTEQRHRAGPVRLALVGSCRRPGLECERCGAGRHGCGCSRTGLRPACRHPDRQEREQHAASCALVRTPILRLHC